VECLNIECSNNNDCTSGKACVNSKCVNPCSVPKVCGDNTDCSIQNDAAMCNCKAGYTGDPHLGCTSILYCATNSQCPTTTKCNNGICTGKKLNRIHFFEYIYFYLILFYFI